MVTIILTWLFFVTVNYYIVHKPFSGANALAILNALADVFVATALFILAGALGRWVLRSFEFLSPLEAIVLQSGVGLGLLSLITFALGLSGFLHPALFWSLLLMALALLRNHLRSLVPDLRSIQLPCGSTFERALGVFCMYTLAAAFVFALLPPVGWDSQTYHLVEAKRAIAIGRITSPPDILYFSFPSLLEMLFLAGMVLKGDIIAQLIHLYFMVLSLGALFALAARYFGSRIAWIACAFLLAVPSMVSVATLAYVDIGLVFYTIAALSTLLIARSKAQTRWFALAGAFAGLAMSVKYTGAIVPIALVPLLFRTRWRQFVVFVVAAALSASPWYLRNLAFTGNPVYPFVFGGQHWDAFRGQWFSRFGTGLFNSPLQLLVAPWEATIYGVDGGSPYEATIGPLLLLLIPALLFTFKGLEEKQKARLREIMLFSSILYLFWILGIAGSKLLSQTRLLFAAFPLFALVAAISFDRLSTLDTSQFSMQRFVRLVVLFVLGLTALSYALGMAANDPIRYLTGNESRELYLSRQLGEYYDAVKFVNSALGAGDKVFFLWEPRVYYVQRAAQPDSILDNWVHLRWTQGDAESIISALKKAGYTHILLSRRGLDYILQTGYDPVSAQDVQVLQDMQRYLKQVYGKVPLQIVERASMPSVFRASDDAYAVYEIAGMEMASK